MMSRQFPLTPPWRGLTAVLALLAVVSMAAAEDAPANAQAKSGKSAKEAPTAQLALLLDTSNSMDGLIDQAKSQLWNIVGEFTKLELAGKTPRLQVALYEYGNDGLPVTEGYLRQVVPMTDDLDRVSEAMFALKTDGGSEYCGKVILTATRQLDWSSRPGDLRAIFIAGNEEFTQGDVDYQGACQAAAKKGITVSTIFCGDRDQGIRTMWADGAKLADGSYFCINQDKYVATIDAPQDTELGRLSSELNATYLPFGDAETRKKAVNRQGAQDANAAKSAASTVAARAGFKASSLYRNSGWDLVDAVADGKVKLADLSPDQLPEAMQSMAPAAQQAYLNKMSVKRKAVQAEIQKIAAARDAYVAKEQARMIAAEPEAADAFAAPLMQSIQGAIQQQIEK